MSKMEKFIKNYTYGFTFPCICISFYNANGDLLRKKMFNRFQDAAGNLGYFCHECGSYDEITNYLKRKILDDMHDGAMVMSPIAESHDSIDDLDNSKNPDIVIFSWNQYERDWILNQVDEKVNIPQQVYRLSEKAVPPFRGKCTAYPPRCTAHSLGYDVKII